MHKILIRRFACYLLTLACFALVGASVLLAQGGGSITGVVTDATGAVVPGATVTVTNSATGVKFTAKTNSAGNYVFTAMLPATYTVEVAAKGFRTYVNTDLVLNTDQTLRADATLEVGQETQMITVEAAAPLINTSEGRMQNLVSGAQVANMPLNGRNIYELMQLIPGAVNSTQIDMESDNHGIQTNINGSRANFNGFLFDGVSNKGLSGGSNSQPAPDFVQEFVIQTNNFSAEYSSSAGSITDVSTKAGTNQFHGDAWEFFRNDKLNARNFFDGDTRSEWRQNQFGATLGGPIKKDKIFFFGGYEGERFRTADSKQYFIESAGWKSAVQSALPNSVAALLYKNFPNPVATSGQTVDQIVNTNVTGGPGDIGGTIGADYTGTGTNLSDAYLGYTDPCFLSSFVGVGIPAVGSATWGNPQTVANNSAALFGVTAAENTQITANIAAGCPGSGLVAPGVQGGAISRSALMEGLVNASNSTRTKGVFYNGDQYTARGDYEGDQNRVSARWFFFMQKDPGPTPLTGLRGFTNPLSESFPGGVISFVHTFSPTVVNEFRFGYTRNQLGYTVPKGQYGVPDIGFDSGEPQFGAYNGYPQFFNEDVFNFKDMVSLVKGKHSLKIGGEFKRNYENSEFDVGRPSYYFFDPVYFASDLPYIQASGVNPELAKGPNQGHIDTNIRAWRNYEVGWFVQDDYKVTKNLTLNLGLRWDFFSPHTEKYNHATQLVLGPGDNQAAKIASINCETFLNGTCLLPAGDTQSPNGGFTAAPSLFPDRWKNFAPRVGFAWDPFGTGKTSLRGGAALSYEASFYNALSNSRWNLPFYSFNEASPLLGIPGLPTYGPTNSSGNATGATPTYTGPPSNVGQGPAGLGFAGNIMGWLPSNPNLAVLTGIPSANYKLPYVEQFFLGVQHQFSPSTVLEVNGVMNLGRHLFWAEDVNRVVGGKQRPAHSVINPCTGAAPKHTPTINPCFGHMRTWETSVNSSYEALQVSLNRRASHGLTYTTAYTRAHSIDLRSTWHALSSSGSATDRNSFGEAGYSLDSNHLFLERGNSLFDIRHRIVGSVQWELPWMKDQHGFAGRVLGGWQVNSVISLQTGFPYTVGCHCDYNGDGVKSDRPNTPSFGNYMYFTHSQFENGALASLKSAFPKPAAGTDGNLGRNTFSGPGFADTDFSLFKKIPVGERVSLQFRAEFFNLLNHANLYPPVANLADSSFGLTQQAFDPRELQFGLKLIF